MVKLSACNSGPSSRVDNFPFFQRPSFSLLPSYSHYFVLGFWLFIIRDLNQMLLNTEHAELKPYLLNHDSNLNA